MCPPDRDERRNRSPTIFIFEGSDGEGTDAHPLWGPRARFWAGRADGPSQRSTHPLTPSKTKVAAERCRSGAEVWTCPPDRNERRNRSPTIFIFEGSDGEGTDAHPLWGPRARFWAGRADGPSQRSTHPLAPSKTKVAAERCRSGAEVWTCPPDRNERRNRSPTIFIFEGSDGEGTDAHPLWGPRARFWAGRADGPSQRSTRPLAPSKTKVAAERCRSGAEVWTCPPDRNERRNRSPTIFIFEGSDGEGTDAHPLWGARARFWAGRVDGPSQWSTNPLAPSKTKVAAERCRSGAEVWTCPPDRNERRNRSPTIFIFEGSDGEGTDAHPLWGPRARFWAGRADGPSQGSTHPLAPSKTKVAAERCRSGAEVWTCPPDWDERRNRSPTIFIFEGSDGEGTDAHPLWGARARFWAGRVDGPSQWSTSLLAPSKTKVAAERCRSGAEVWTCPPDRNERRNRSPTIFIFEGSDGEGTDARPLWGPRARFWAGRADGPSQRSTQPLAPSKTKVAAERCRSGAEVSRQSGRVPLTGTSDGIAPRRFSFSRGRTGKGLTLTRSGALVHVSGQAVRTALLRARLTRSLPRKRKSRQSAAVLGPRCGRVPQTGTSDGIAPRRFSFSRGRTGKGLTLTRSGALVHVSGQAVWTALLSGRQPARSLENESRGRALPFWGRGVDVSPSLGRATVSLPDDFHFRGERGRASVRGGDIHRPGGDVRSRGSPPLKCSGRMKRAGNTRFSHGRGP